MGIYYFLRNMLYSFQSKAYYMFRTTQLVVRGASLDEARDLAAKEDQAACGLRRTEEQERIAEELNKELRGMVQDFEGKTPTSEDLKTLSGMVIDMRKLLQGFESEKLRESLREAIKASEGILERKPK